MGKDVSRRRRQQVMKDKAKNRVDDLQCVFTDLQLARKESRTGDLVVLEAQVHQMLREWKHELSQPSPAPSSSSASPLLPGGNAAAAQASSDLSSEIRRLLQLYEEEDDATSKLAELPPLGPKSEPAEDVPQPEAQVVPAEGSASAAAAAAAFHEGYYMDQELPEDGFLGPEQYHNGFSIGLNHDIINCIDGTTHLDYQQFILHQDSMQSMFHSFDNSGQNNGDVAPHISELMQAICPPPAAFLRAKCALWDCPRPAQASEWCHDYCSSFHATLALNEGPPGRTPVLRPGGIDLKDGPLFAALTAKTHGKNVGIPECEGAATSKSPWNAPELFDLLVFEGESLREWLFFDKPRRAFESGNRKQRSLPDYNGRGWHESRKQVMKEFGGLKRSYYMDPQPQGHLEWHLYEYEINNCDACALYRLELKLVDPKKITKGKLTSDSLVDLQQQMGRLNAASPMDNKRYVKGRAKVNKKEVAENVCSTSEIAHQKENAQKAYASLNQTAPANDKVVYGPTVPHDYPVESLNGYYGT